MTNTELISSLKKRKGELEKKYGVQELGVFGSRVRGDNRHDSDLDVLIDFKKPYKLDLLGLISLELELGEDLDVTIDLVLKSNIRPSMAKKILSETVYL